MEWYQEPLRVTPKQVVVLGGVHHKVEAPLAVVGELPLFYLESPDLEITDQFQIELFSLQNY